MNPDSIEIDENPFEVIHRCTIYLSSSDRPTGIDVDEAHLFSDYILCIIYDPNKSDKLFPSSSVVKIEKQWNRHKVTGF